MFMFEKDVVELCLSLNRM